MKLILEKQDWKHFATTDVSISFSWQDNEDDWEQMAIVPLKAWREGRPIKLHKITRDRVNRVAYLHYEEA